MHSTFLPKIARTPFLSVCRHVMLVEKAVRPVSSPAPRPCHPFCSSHWDIHSDELRIFFQPEFIRIELSLRVGGDDITFPQTLHSLHNQKLHCSNFLFPEPHHPLRRYSSFGCRLRAAKYVRTRGRLCNKEWLLLSSRSKARALLLRHKWDDPHARFPLSSWKSMEIGFVQTCWKFVSPFRPHLPPPFLLHLLRRWWIS